MKVKVMQYKMPYFGETDYERAAQRLATREHIEQMRCIPIEGTEVEVDASIVVNGARLLDLSASHERSYYRRRAAEAVQNFVRRHEGRIIRHDKRSVGRLPEAL